MTNAFQNPLSRRGENPRGPNGRFMQKDFQPIRTEDETKSPERTSTPILEDSVLETTIQLSPPNTSQSYGRGRKKLTRNRAEKATGKDSPAIQIENRGAEEFRREPEDNVITRNHRNSPKR